MVRSVSGLVRSWRSQLGWTQADLAEAIRASATAVSGWETGARRLPLAVAEQLDVEFGAGGFMVDLVRAIGALRAYRSDREGPVMEPRRFWGHIFDGPPGPVWAWLRPASGSQVRGYAYSRPLAQYVDEVTGPDGIFLTAPYWDPRLPLHVILAEPGWVDFGRGWPPDWLDVPRKQSADLRDLVVVNPRERLVDFLRAELRRRNRGDLAALWPLLRSSIDPAVWDRLEAALQRRERKPRPPQSPQERRSLHRQLRHVRGMSQADAATAATRILASDGDLGPRLVTQDQIRNYEAGRTSRVRYLPALLDRAYRVFGWSCYEPVPVRRRASGLFEARFPGFWTGPVTLSAEPATPFPQAGTITFSWRLNKLIRDLPAGPAAFSFCRTSGNPPLRVQVPPGWAVTAHAGQNPDALDANADWEPVDNAAGQEIFDIFNELLSGGPRPLKCGAP